MALALGLAVFTFICASLHKNVAAGIKTQDGMQNEWKQPLGQDEAELQPALPLTDTFPSPQDQSSSQSVGYSSAQAAEIFRVTNLQN